MLDLEFHSAPATRKQHALFLKRLRAEVTYPDSRGSREHRSGSNRLGTSYSLAEMEALFSLVRRGSFLYHLVIQPDDEVPFPFELEELVRDAMQPIRGRDTRWVTIIHPSHGLFPHAHVFMTGPELTRHQLAEMREGAQVSWNKMVAFWEEVVADAEESDRAMFALLHEEQAQQPPGEA